MKKAFTIIEMMLAISIFTLIVFYMYEAISVSNKSTNTYENQYKIIQNDMQIKKIFYNDIFNQLNLYANVKIIEDKDSQSVLYLQTNNSLYDQIAPHVIYTLKNKTLYRVESLKKIMLPIKNVKEHFNVDVIAKDVKNFKVFSAKNNFLIKIDIKGRTSVFQIALPYGKKVIEVSSQK